MMKPVLRIDDEGACATSGRVVLDTPKALWNGSSLLVALVGCSLLFSWSALALFVVTTYLSLLLGHSVGMHRMLIHRTFECAKPVERFLIYLGVLVGVAGPFGIVRIHDLRDWAQRQPECHDFFAHKKPLWHDLIWQLAFRFEFDRQPLFTLEDRFQSDPFYGWLERTWRLQQVPLAVLFFWLGGWSWVVWGICARVFVGAAGHWTITYFCHNPGSGRWSVPGASVQASNIEGLGLLTFGECWHNNHHAFPESAKIGIYPGQLDPGWWVIRGMKWCGLVQNVGLPRAEQDREDLLLAPPY